MIRARDNDREQRHVQVPARGYRQDWREKVIYANDMTIGTGIAITSVGVSPCHMLSGKGNWFLYADLKMPIDRVPGTPMLMKAVYCTDGGGGNIAMYVDMLVASKGDDLTTAVGRYWIITIGSPANIQNVTPTVTIQSVKLDGLIPSVDFQLRIGRDGNNALDTSNDILYLFKLIFEYMAYV